MDNKRRLELMTYAMHCFNKMTSPFERTHLIQKNVKADECFELSELVGKAIYNHLFADYSLGEIAWAKADAEKAFSESQGEKSKPEPDIVALLLGDQKSQLFYGLGHLEIANKHLERLSEILTATSTDDKVPVQHSQHFLKLYVPKIEKTNFHLHHVMSYFSVTALTMASNQSQKTPDPTSEDKPKSS